MYLIHRYAALNRQCASTQFGGRSRARRPALAVGKRGELLHIGVKLRAMFATRVNIVDNGLRRQSARRSTNTVRSPSGGQVTGPTCSLGRKGTGGTRRLWRECEKWVWAEDCTNLTAKLFEYTNLILSERVFNLMGAVGFAHVLLLALMGLHCSSKNIIN